MDSLRVDILAAGKGAVAERLVHDLIAHLRWRSRQWWIGRSMDALTGYLRHVSLIREDGSFASAPAPHAQLRTASVEEIPVTDAVWQTVSGDLNRLREVPIHEILLNDSQFFAAVNDVRRSILDSATACEYVKDMTAERLWKAANPGRKFRLSQRFPGRELPEHIARLGALSGRSFENEFPGSTVDIQRLWLAGTRFLMEHLRSRRETY